MLLVTVIKAQQYASVSEDGLEDTGKKRCRSVDKLMSKTFFGWGYILAFKVNYIPFAPSFLEFLLYPKS